MRSASRLPNRCRAHVIVLCISGDKLTTHFVMCGWLFFQQQYVLPILRQSDGAALPATPPPMTTTSRRFIPCGMPHRSGTGKTTRSWFSPLDTSLIQQMAPFGRRERAGNRYRRVMPNHRLAKSKRTAYLMKKRGRGWRCRSLMNQPLWRDDPSTG